MWRQMQVTGALARHWNAVDVQGANDAPFPAGGKLAGVRGPGGAPLQPMPRVSFAADPPTGSMGSSGSTSQLVQAMAGFGGSSGAADGVNTAPVGAETSQQPLLTTPQHV